MSPTNLPVTGPIAATTNNPGDPTGAKPNELTLRVECPKGYQKLLAQPPFQKDTLRTCRVVLQNAQLDLGANPLRFRTTSPCALSFPDRRTVVVSLEGSLYGLKRGGFMLQFPALTVSVEGLALVLDTPTDVAVVGEMHHPAGMGTLFIACTTNPEGDQLLETQSKRGFALKL